MTIVANPSLSVAAPDPNAPKLRAAILGHTGRGDYGHGMDVAFNDRPDLEVVAVADPDPAGRAKAAARTKAPRHYADYRELLENEKPQLASLAPRHSDQHHAMGLAALQAGAHIYSEKPFTTTLAEADELLALAAQKKLRIAVAHQMRLAPNVVHLQQSLAAGLLGDLLEIRAHGKQDARAGGEDLIVLGTHLFDLLRLFAGDPVSCSARILQGGRDITPADAREVRDRVGLVAGDEVMAQFAFANGVHGTFTSRAKLREHVGHWGLEIIGTKGTARLNANIPPHIFILKSTGWKSDGRTDEWRPLETDPALKLPAAAQGFAAANARVVDDLLQSIRDRREPACSGHNAMRAIEMVHATYHAALTGRSIPLPLITRTHPLAAP
ncbi:3-chlorobenzoate-3,4-dioxygenase dehydrogenase [Verrucomicrobiota bacterium]|nr:3-chlorobenzoate-3,4-dioxygenase dehydrogenase [Verrucomicrobiota bacterium]